MNRCEIFACTKRRIEGLVLMLPTLVNWTQWNSSVSTRQCKCYPIQRSHPYVQNKSSKNIKLSTYIRVSLEVQLLSEEPLKVAEVVKLASKPVWQSLLVERSVSNIANIIQCQRGQNISQMNLLRFMKLSKLVLLLPM